MRRCFFFFFPSVGSVLSVEHKGCRDIQYKYTHTHTHRSVVRCKQRKIVKLFIDSNVVVVVVIVTVVMAAAAALFDEMSIIMI